EKRAGAPPPAQPLPALKLIAGSRFGLRTIAATMLRRYRRRTVLGLVLMASQAFLYNAIFFTYALVLTHFYAVPAADAGLYLLPFAAGNFLGPLLLGRWFDTLGRKPMIAGTYALSALLLIATGALFAHGMLSALEQTVAWSVIFFFASAAASAAYLTVSEIFPLEIRAQAIAVFYAFGTAVGGLLAPWLFGILIGTGSRIAVLGGYVVAALLMLGAAIVEVVIGIPAERRPLEAVAAPLSAVEDP
ncbi:MAG TPA: MFS transporter, partial [Gammaproteobacteria bacterium]|nr:MFS transporter [Gammaproteobacteria bacterium]